MLQSALASALVIGELGYTMNLLKTTEIKFQNIIIQLFFENFYSFLKKKSINLYFVFLKG